MAEQRPTAKIVLVTVLALVLGFVFIARMGILPTGSGKKSGTTAGSKGKAGQTLADAKSVGPSSSTEVRWKRPDAIGPVVSDPMRMAMPRNRPEKAAAPVDTEPEWRVAGIIYSTQQPSSIIVDGRILHEGDTIHGATVLKITESYAVIRQGDKTWQIRAGQTNKGSDKGSK
jgi:hypothetical protein